MAKRSRKSVVKIHNTESIESLMQETYNDACDQIHEAQRNINSMTNSAEPEEVQDYTAIASQKTNAMKIKDSAIKIKLEIAKLQGEFLKKTSNIQEEAKATDSPSIDDFSKIQQLVKNINSSTDGEYKID